MTGFSSVFGGSTVQPAQVSYRAVALAASIALVWPSYSKGPTDYAARTMDVTPASAGLTLTLPPANAVSVGYDLLISNPGAFSFNVLDNAGGTIVTIAPGAVYYVQVTVNTTPAGTWKAMGFGTTVSAVTAGSLVGPGIGANGAALQASAPVTTVSANTAITAADRAKVFVWTGGVGTITLPLGSAAGVGSDFFIEVRNQGTGVLTLSCAGSDTVDGSASISYQPTEASAVHSSGLGPWYTVGRGRSTQFSFTLLVKNITGGTVTLSTTEAANVVQRYTGALTSNANIVLPSVVQVYYISNQTTGAFTVTFKTSGAGATVSIPANANAVLFCDGLNVVNTSTTVSGLTSLTLAQGSVSNPSINYSGDTSTGIYQLASGHVDVSISGVLRGDFNNTGLDVNGRVSATGGEALRIFGTNPYLAGYDPTNTTRQNYIQFSVGNLTLASEGAGAVIDLATVGAVRARIDALGNLGVGLTAAAGYRLDVAGTIRSVGGEATAAGYGFRALNSTGTSGMAMTAQAGTAGGLLSSDANPMTFTGASFLFNNTVTAPNLTASSAQPVISLVRPTPASGQNTINFVTTSTGHTWQLYQQGSSTDLNIFNSAFGNNLMVMTELGAITLNASSGLFVNGTTRTAGVGGEGLRMGGTSGAPFLSGYDNAGTTRSGYLQFGSGVGGQITLANEIGGPIVLNTGGGNLTLDSTGRMTVSAQTAFNVQRSATQSMGQNLTTDIIFDAPNTNVGGQYNATNGIFLAPVAGVYVFSTALILQSNGAGSITIGDMWLSVNNNVSFGTAGYYGLVNSYGLNGVLSGGGANAGTVGGTVVVKLAANDTVRVKIQTGPGPTGLLAVRAGSYFSGYLEG